MSKSSQTKSGKRKAEDIAAQVAKREAQSQQKGFVEQQNLPTSYNTTRLTLLARDPFWVHAYWEISQDDINRLRGQLGDTYNYSTIVLRLYDISMIDFSRQHANQWFDVDVGFHVRKWYVNIWNDNVTYCADIGIRTPNGEFFAFARSNMVQLPRASSSQRQDLIWMELQENQEQAPFVNLYTDKAGRRKGTQKKPQVTSQKYPRSYISGKRHYLTEDDIRAYYSNLFPLLRRVRRFRKQKGRGEQRSLRDILGDKVKGKQLEDFLASGMSWAEYYKKILLGSSAEMVLKKGASESVLSPGASERREAKRKFFFEIGAELIVYGRTEPDAEVFLGDKKIPLNQDGTFSLRYALPDGKIPFDFVAISHDKVEQRRISTAVERSKTIYSP